MTISPVPAASIAGMGITFIIALAAAVAAFYYGWKKLRGRLSSFAFGAIVYYVVSKLIEPVISATLIGFTGAAMTGNIVAFAIMAALIAAFFEEGGKFLAMKTLIHGITEEDAFMYGAGAGVLEALLLTVFPQVGHILNSLLINNGIMEESLKLLEEPDLTNTYNAIVPLWETPAISFWMAGFERVIMIVMCISLSLMIYYYLKEGERRMLLFPFAAHFFVTCISTLLVQSAGVIVAELATLLMVVGIVYYTLMTRRTICEQGSEYVSAEASEDHDDYIDL